MAKREAQALKKCYPKTQKQRIVDPDAVHVLAQKLQYIINNCPADYVTSEPGVVLSLQSETVFVITLMEVDCAWDKEGLEENFMTISCPL